MASPSMPRLSCSLFSVTSCFYTFFFFNIWWIYDFWFMTNSLFICPYNEGYYRNVHLFRKNTNLVYRRLSGPNILLIQSSTCYWLVVFVPSTPGGFLCYIGDSWISNRRDYLHAWPTGGEKNPIVGLTNNSSSQVFYTFYKGCFFT